MEILFGLFILALVLSFPIFYIWGIVAFFKNLNRNDKPKPRTTDDADTYNLLRAMRHAAESDPDISLRAFMTEAGFTGPWDEDAPATDDARAVENTPAEDASSEGYYPYPAREDERPPEREAGFSWRNWYQENTVNLLLYLGAFLIVAAVSLFVGFQWQNFGGTMRFAVVLLFTLGWYAGGLIVERSLKLESVGIAFITLGALLTPFCGVAWQQFVIGGPDGLGITWLITSLISTAVYLGLSFIYRRHYFTYFGSLSILAMILALVEINNAPAEYFILTATLSALVLLLVRVGLRFAPDELREFYERDFEYASLGTLLLSVVVGIVAIPAQDIPFYSVEVLAVTAVTAVYAWVYASLRLNAITLAIAQVLTLFAVDHALVTFNVATTPRVLLGGGIHFGLLVLLNLWLVQREDATLYRQFNRVSVFVTALYAVGGVGTENNFVALLLVLMLGAHAAYVAYVHSTAWMYHITAAVAYLGAGYLMDWVNLPDDYWLPVFTALAAAELYIAYSPLPRPARAASARVGMIALGLWLLGSVAYIDGGNTLLIGMITSYAVLAIYSAFAYVELTAPTHILSRWWHALATFAAVLAYGLALALDFAALYYMGYMVLVIVLAALAYLITRFAPLVSVAVLAPYIAIYHLLDVFNAPNTAYPVVFALLSVALYLLDSVVSSLPDESHTPRKLTVLGALVAICVNAYVGATTHNDAVRYFAGWFAGYTLVGLVVSERVIWNRRARDYLVAVVTLPVYFWHVEYLDRFVNSDLFGDIQWYSAAVGTVALVLAWREIEREVNANVVNVLVGFGGASFFLTTLVQIGDTGLLAYFLLGILYALLFVAFGVTLNWPLARQIGIVALVLVVLVQTRDFFFNLPRWFIVGLVGFGLIGAAVFLSMRRRAGTEKPEG